jgi:hypothetical protein
VAAVPVVLLLFFGLGVMLLYANRALIFEQRTAANQARATQALELAEAGLEWALAMLNLSESIDASCLPAASATDNFRDRLLTFDAASGLITPRTDPADADRLLRATCAIVAGAPVCSCPGSGLPSFAQGVQGPMYSVEFAAVAPARAGVVRLTATGCTSTGAAEPDPACLPGASGRADARAQVTVLLARLPALATAPAAVVTLTGNFGPHGAGASVDLYNTDTGTRGITVHAGGTVEVTTVPGTPPLDTLLGSDPTLAALAADPDALFTGYFNMSKAAWRAAATRLTCGSDCAAQVQQAHAAGAQMIWIDGDAVLNSSTPLGSTARPLALVVDGQIELRGNTEFIGLIYATTWDLQGGGRTGVRGAAISEGSLSANGSADLYFDASVMLQLQQGGAGVFSRLPGSWRDF